MKKQLFLALAVTAISGVATGTMENQTESFCKAIRPTIITIITQAWNEQQLCNTSSYTVTPKERFVEVTRIPATNTITIQEAANAVKTSIINTTSAICGLCNNGLEKPEKFLRAYTSGDQNTIKIQPVFLEDPFTDSDEEVQGSSEED